MFFYTQKFRSIFAGYISLITCRSFITGTTFCHGIESLAYRAIRVIIKSARQLLSKAVAPIGSGDEF